MIAPHRRLLSAGLGLLAVGLLLAPASGLLQMRAGRGDGSAARSSSATTGTAAFGGPGRQGGSSTVGGTSGLGFTGSGAAGAPPPGGGVSPSEGSTTAGPPGGLTTSSRADRPGGVTTTTAGTQTPGSGSVPRGDPAQRLAQAARDAGYVVLRLDDDSWSLGGVEVGIFGRQVYLDSVYRRDTDYVNVSQSPEGEFPDPPGSEAVTVRQAPGRLLDMGNIVLVQWLEGRSRITVTSDLERQPLLALLEALGAVAP